MPYRKETLAHGDETTFRVLCAEDDPHIAVLLKVALKGGGHFVECVPDGLAAIDRVKSQPDFFDLIITDHRMPQSTGLILVRALRQINFPGRIFVHCSGLRPADETEYRRLSVDRLFEKPVHSAELIKVVCALRRAK